MHVTHDRIVPAVAARRRSGSARACLGDPGPAADRGTNLAIGAACLLRAVDSASS